MARSWHRFIGLLLLGLGLTLAGSGTARAANEKWALRVHPDGGLFVGDVVSFEVLPPEDWTPQTPAEPPQVRLQIQPPHGPRWQAPLRPSGVAGRWMARFPWVWPTHGQTPGAYEVRVTVAEREVLRQFVHLAPAEQRPWWEEGLTWQQMAWADAEIHYLSRTPPARDLALIRHALTAMHRDLVRQGLPAGEAPFGLVLMPRLLGQGGFASRYLWVTYTDRDATATYFPMVARHELVHWLDRQRSAKRRLLLLQEGLAVYFAGGHYKPEPLAPRAAALLLWGRFLPISELAQGYFYDHQHEIAYLEAGALVEYMIRRWGWDAFAQLYWGLDPAWGEDDAQILDAGLRHYLGVSLPQLDADFRAYLETQPDAAVWLDDVRLTVALYETLRRYQRQMDPAAYYGTAWLPDLEAMQRVGAVADAVRGPASTAHVTVELLLQVGQLALAAGDSTTAQRAVDAVQALLEADARGQTEPWRAHPWAAQIGDWVQTARACGLEPVDLWLRPDGSAWVWGWPEGQHPHLAALRVAAGAADSTACEWVDLRSGLLWETTPSPLYLPGPRHGPRYALTAGRP